MTKRLKFIVLVGIKHSGKSSLGKIVAQNLNCTFIDVDDVIESCSKLSCRDLYRQKGVDAFQSFEVTACEQVVQNVSSLGCSVIATGGGICNNSQALAVLKDAGAVFMYLVVPEDISCSRIISSSENCGSYPPYIVQAIKTPCNGAYEQSEVRKAYHSFYVERTKKYEEIADVFVPVDDATPKENAATLLRKINSVL